MLFACFAVLAALIPGRWAFLRFGSHLPSLLAEGRLLWTLRLAFLPGDPGCDRGPRGSLWLLPGQAG